MNARLLFTSASLALVAGVSAAQAEDLTLCWAAWDPANALIELSKDYEAQSGNTMNFEFVPWTNFADRMLNELNSGGKLCGLCLECGGNSLAAISEHWDLDLIRRRGQG